MISFSLHCVITIQETFLFSSKLCVSGKYLGCRGVCKIPSLVGNWIFSKFHIALYSFVNYVYCLGNFVFGS